MPAETRRRDMIYRALGRTGENVLAGGLRGSHMGPAASDDAATEIARTAIAWNPNRILRSRRRARTFRRCEKAGNARYIGSRATGCSTLRATAFISTRRCIFERDGGDHRLRQDRDTGTGSKCREDV
jgi:hypothetical protein